MKRDTAIERVSNALRAEGGRASTQRLCEVLPGMDRGLVLMALAHLKRRELVDSDYAPRKQPPCGWTYWFTPAKKVHRGSRFKAAVSNGYTRLVVEYLDAAGGEAPIDAWLAWSAQITHRVRLHSGVHSLRRRGLIEVAKTYVRLTDTGRQALALGRTVAPIAPTIADFEDIAEPETRSTDPEACVARAEKLWPKLMRGRRYEDIPAHLIRPQRVLRWTPPLQERSMTGSSGAMLAETRDATGGTP
jgi:hypothetical protein